MKHVSLNYSLNNIKKLCLVPDCTSECAYGQLLIQI